MNCWSERTVSKSEREGQTPLGFSESADRGELWAPGQSVSVQVCIVLFYLKKKKKVYLTWNTRDIMSDDQLEKTLDGAWKAFLVIGVEEGL